MSSEINPTYNLNSHYTSVSKIEKSKHVVAQAPDNIPEYQTFNDQKARKRLAELDNDIFVDYQKVPKHSKNKKKFFGLF